MHKLLIATHNPGKIREYRELLADLPLDVVSLADEDITLDVEETGSTFAENAILKAHTYAQLSHRLTWADDSGLEVDALAGRPGIYSARYGGPTASDRQRCQKLLQELSPYPPDSWTTRFRCVVAIVAPGGQTRTIEETVEGIITDQPRGAAVLAMIPYSIYQTYTLPWQNWRRRSKIGSAIAGRPRKQPKECFMIF